MSIVEGHFLTTEVAVPLDEKLMIAPLNIRNTTELVFRRRKAFLSVLGIGLLLYAGLVLTQRLEFESDATVLVKIADQDVTTPDAVATRQSQGAASLATMAESLLNSEILVFKSADVLNATLAKAGLETVYPGITEKAARKKIPVEDYAAEKLLKDLEVKINANTNIMLLSLLNVDPGVAQSTLSDLISVATEKQAAITHAPRLQFLEGNLENLRKGVGEAQQALEDFRTKNNISSLTEEKTLLLTQRDQAQSSLNDAISGLAAGQSKEASIRQQLARTPASIPLSDENDKTSVQVDNAQARLAAAEADFNAAKQRFAEGNPQLIDAQAQYDLAKKNYSQLSSESGSRIRSGANPVYQQLLTDLGTGEAESTGARAQIEQRRAQMQVLQDRIAFLDSSQPAMHELESRLEAADDAYKSYLQQTGSAQIMSDINAAGISTLAVVQNPSLPYKATYPRRLLLLAMTLFASLTGGLALCIAMESFSDTVALPEQVQQSTGLPVLVTIDARGSKRANAMGKVLTNLQVVNDRNSAKIIKSDSDLVALPHADQLPAPLDLPVDDEMVSLLQAIQHALSPDAPWAVGIVSCSSGEGVSSIARGLARVASQGTVYNTLLCEVARPGDGRTILGSDLSAPLLAGIASMEEILACSDARLVADRLAWGSIADSRLLGMFAADPNRTRASVNLLKAAFGQVIFDLPPMSQGSTGLSLARALDCVIIVMEAQKTSTRKVRAAHEAIANCGGKVLGIVLNKRRYSLPARWRGMLS